MLWILTEVENYTNAWNNTLISSIYFVFMKPKLNAPPFIHQVTLFDWYFDALWRSSSPSSGGAVSNAKFPTRQMVFNNYPTTCCGNSVFDVGCWDGSPWRWRRRAPKRVGVLVKQRDFVYERWCIKCWFTEDQINRNIMYGMYNITIIFVAYL